MRYGQRFHRSVQDQAIVDRFYRAVHAPEQVTLNLRIIRQTEKAVLVELAENARGQTWLPKSQIRMGEPVDGVVSVTVPQWLSDKHEQLKGA